MTFKFQMIDSPLAKTLIKAAQQQLRVPYIPYYTILSWTRPVEFSRRSRSQSPGNIPAYMGADGYTRP